MAVLSLSVHNDSLGGSTFDRRHALRGFGERITDNMDYPLLPDSLLADPGGVQVAP